MSRLPSSILSFITQRRVVLPSAEKELLPLLLLLPCGCRRKAGGDCGAGDPSCSAAHEGPFGGGGGVDGEPEDGGRVAPDGRGGQGASGARISISMFNVQCPRLASGHNVQWSRNGLSSPVLVYGMPLPLELQVPSDQEQDDGREEGEDDANAHHQHGEDHVLEPRSGDDLAGIEASGLLS